MRRKWVRANKTKKAPIYYTQLYRIYTNEEHAQRIPSDNFKEKIIGLYLNTYCICTRQEVLTLKPGYIKTDSAKMHDCIVGDNFFPYNIFLHVLFIIHFFSYNISNKLLINCPKLVSNVLLNVLHQMHKCFAGL